MSRQSHRGAFLPFLRIVCSFRPEKPYSVAALKQFPFVRKARKPSNALKKTAWALIGMCPLTCRSERSDY